MSRILAAHLALIAANLLYGINYSIAKYPMPENITPFAFVLIRVVVSGLLFWLLHALTVRERIANRDIPLFILCGLSGVSANQLMFIGGLNITTEINASLIMITTPVLVPFLAYFIIKARVTLLTVIGITLGAIGASWIIVFGQDFTFSSQTRAGDLLIFLNAVSYALYLVIAKPLLRKYNPITVIMWTFVLGFPVVFLFGFPSFVDIAWSSFDWKVWTSIGFVVIGATFLAYLLNVIALAHVNSSVVGIYIYSQPFIASVVAMAIGSDRLTITKIIAAVLIFTGVMLVSRIGPFRKRSSASTALTDPSGGDR